MPEPAVVEEGDAAVKDAIDKKVAEPSKDAKEDTKSDKPATEHEPPADSPRFKEVYYNWKETERKLKAFKAEQEQKEAARAAEIEAIKAHNKALAESIGDVQGALSSVTRPDPLEDPEGYDQWMKESVKRELLQEIKGDSLQPEPPLPAYQPPPSSRPEYDAIPPEMKAKQAVQESLHDDYAEMEAIAFQDMEADPALRNHIISAPDPFKTAYEYGKRRKELLAQEKKKTTDQAYVESGTKPQPDTPKRQMTDIERRIQMGLGIPEDKMLEQLKAIEAAKMKGV